jgi:hypothetical protein
MKNLSKLLVSLIGAFSIANASAADIVNLLTSETGMQRVTYEHLRDNGADLIGIKHRNFSLTQNGEPVAIYVKGQDQAAGASNQFGPGAYIEFYAEQNQSFYTDKTAYTLGIGSRSARTRIPKVRTAFNEAAVSATVYEHTQVIEENNLFDSLAPSFKDPWHYGFSVGHPALPTQPYPFELENVANGSGLADVAVEMYGLLDYSFAGNDHHYELLINDVKIGEEQFDGVTIAGIEATDVAIQDGQNTIEYNYLPIAEAALDRVTLNRMIMTYSRNTVAVDGVLAGRFDTPQAIVSNLGTTTAKVYRKNDDGSIERIIGTKQVGDDTGFATGGVIADYMIVSDADGFKTPEVAAIMDQQDISTGPAEYLIIAHHSLMGDALDDLVQIRSLDYSVKVVDVRQIYAQYGEGVLSSDAIQAYVNHAVANMQTRYVVLVGSDTYDYRNYVFDAVSMVPTKYVTTPGGDVTVHHAPSDSAYGDVNYDGVPDIAVGRISARSEAEFAAVVEKIRDYRVREEYAGGVLVGADKEDVGNGLSFVADAEAMIAAMPVEWASTVTSDYRAFPDIDGAQVAHDKLQTAINAGVSVVSYVGHSSRHNWSNATPNLLVSSEIASFTNFDKPHVAIQWGCWNTYFVNPEGNSMADQFLLAGEMGAVAVLGATTLTTSAEERAYGILLNGYLYDQGRTIGDAVLRAKQDLSQGPDSSPAIQYGYNIIGDPAMVISQ